MSEFIRPAAYEWWYDSDDSYDGPECGPLDSFEPIVQPSHFDASCVHLDPSGEALVPAWAPTSQEAQLSWEVAVDNGWLHETIEEE